MAEASRSGCLIISLRESTRGPDGPLLRVNITGNSGYSDDLKLGGVVTTGAGEDAPGRPLTTIPLIVAPIGSVEPSVGSIVPAVAGEPQRQRVYPAPVGTDSQTHPQPRHFTRPSTPPSVLLMHYSNILHKKKDVCRSWHAC